MLKTLLPALFLAGSTLVAQTATKPRIEVLFALDTTSSMSGLIEGAKQKIWSIANRLVAAKPAPELRIGLVAYRDRGDAYVTQFHDLSDDIDAVYAHLREFRADGGDDMPESVNQALHEAVGRPSWSPDRKVLKIVFLVGDCPPHMDYRDDVKYPATCQAAVRKDILINTIQCGGVAETTPIWQEIARLSEGTYMAIGQTGDMQVVATPMDAELARLNTEMGRTLVPYGTESKKREVAAKQAMAESVALAAPSVAADRLSFNASTRKAVQGGGDLLDDTRSGAVRLEALPKDQLPKEMQSMAPAERTTYLQRKETERTKVQSRINELTKQRQAFLDAEQKKHASKDTFDRSVAEAIRLQAKRKGILYVN